LKATLLPSDAWSTIVHNPVAAFHKLQLMHT